MYKNLKAEMIRQDITAQKIAETLGIQLATARRKINGDIGISLKDCEKVAKLFNEHNTVDYLFKS